MTAADPARRPGDGRFVALVLFAYAAAVLLRMPRIVEGGRFWAEEGTIFFGRAWQLDPLTALLMPYGGYLNLVANAAPLVARWAVPLRSAPYVTILVGLAFQLLPPLILLTARDRWLRPWPVRLAGAALLLSAPGADEIWLQTLHCQFEVTLACGLLLALEMRRGGGLVLSLLVLLLAPLCGPGAVALVPLFLLRVLLDRTPGRALHFAALTAGSACQLAFFFSFGTERGYRLDPALLLAVVTAKNVLIPLMGVRGAREAITDLHGAALAGRVPLVAVLAPLLVFGGLTFAIWRAANRPAFWLLAAAAATSLSAYIGALDGIVALVDVRAGARYAFVPISLTALAILALAAQPVFRWPASILCGVLLFVGYQSFIHPWPPIRNGPDWSEQVARWRADPAYPLQLWPTPWVVSLPPVPVGPPPGSE